MLYVAMECWLFLPFEYNLLIKKKNSRFYSTEIRLPLIGYKSELLNINISWLV